MKKSLTHLARNLRGGQTPAETKLWYYLRSKRFLGFKFRRQYPIDNYIVDFCCPAKRLIIELDGGHHNENRQRKYDKTRDNYLKSCGFKVLRIWNNEIGNNLDGVADEIYYQLNS